MIKPKVKGEPEGYHTITPYLSVQNASGLIAFLKQAFDARDIETHAMPDGTIINAQIKIGDSTVLGCRCSQRSEGAQADARNVVPVR
jgi:uncharacterized glyoxalase superfamily protein PhnB